MNKWLAALSILCVFCLVGYAQAGPNTRTIEVESFETVSQQIEVPSVITDPATFDEALCPIITKADWYCAEYEQIPLFDTFTLDVTGTRHGHSHVFDAPVGTISVRGEYRDLYWDFSSWPWLKWTDWQVADLTHNGGSINWKFSGGNHDDYRGVIATYQELAGYENGECVQDAYVYSPQVVCPPDAIITHTVTVKYSFDRVVPEVHVGEMINIRGHIWTNKLRPVTYWYMVQRVWPNTTPKFIMRTEKTKVPDVEGVYETSVFSFSTEGFKPGIYRIFLRIRKIDGSLGGIYTKVVVNPARPGERFAPAEALMAK